MERFSAEPFIPATADVGESPVIESGGLSWVDMTRGTLFHSALDRQRPGDDRSEQIAGFLGAVVPLATGAGATRPGYAAVFADGFGTIVDGVACVTDAVVPDALHRMNDAKADSAGRLWAGSTHVDFAQGQGRLHVWDGRASAVAADGLTLPNGIGWSPDDRSIYLADSMTHELLVADFDAARGTIGPLRVLATVASGLPDGLAVDLDGGIWLAVWGAGEIHRYTPSGVCDAVISVPTTQPASCALDHDGTLYITSARSGLSAAELASQPAAGSIFAVHVGRAPVPVHPFGG